MMLFNRVHPHPTNLASTLSQDTIDALVNASGLPLSFLIVGIGNSPELSKMEVSVFSYFSSSSMHHVQVSGY